MAVRTRKTTSTLPSDPVVDPAAAPTRRRVPGTRAAATRRPATSSRTLRPILPPEVPVAVDLEPETPAEPVVEAAIPEAPPVAEVAPTLPAASEPEPVAEAVAPVAEPAAPAAAEEVPVAALEIEIPAAEVVIVAPAFELPALPTTAEEVTSAVEIPVLEVAAEPVIPAAEIPVPEAVVAPDSGLPLLVEQLQADVRALQGLVTDRTELTVVELGRTTMQMVRMVTGVAHHLDKLAEQVQQLSCVAQTLAQSLTRVESTVATLHSRTQDQIHLATRGQRELQDVLSPVLSELVAIRTQAARNTSVDRLDQFRLGVELKQLRQSVENSAPTSEVVSPIVRPTRAPRTKR